MSKIFTLNTNHFKDSKGFDFSRGEILIVGLEVIFFLLFFCRHGLSHFSSLIPLDFLTLFLLGGFYWFLFLHFHLHYPSILFYVVGGGRRHDARLDSFDRKTTQKKNRGFLHGTEVKSSGDIYIYIKNFYTRKYLSYKKTEP